MKIVVLETADGAAIVRGPELVHSFAPYPALEDLAKELDIVRSQIVANVSA